MVISGNLLGPLFAIFVSSFNATAFQVSVSWATMIIAGLLTSVVVSRFIGDSTRRSVGLVTAGYVISAFAWLAYIAVDNIPQLLIVQVFLGVGLAIGTAPFQALFAEHLDKGKHIHDYADKQIISKVIEFSAVLAGGAILTLFGFDVLFMIMSLLTLLAAIIMAGLPRTFFEGKS